MIRAVIFDLNGVFLESRLLSDRMEEVYGVPSNKFRSALKEAMTKVREPKAFTIYKLLAPYFTEWKLKLTEKEFLEFWFSGEKLSLELLSYVKELRNKGLKVYILSNNFKERTEYYRKHFLQIFEAVNKAYFSLETGFIKPNEEAFRNVLEENKLNPEDCIFFDDSEKNVDVANSIGIHALKYQGLQNTKNVIGELLN